MKRAATVASTMQETQFYARPTPARRHQVLTGIRRGAPRFAIIKMSAMCLILHYLHHAKLTRYNALSSALRRR
jgi:hypothetical protein